MPVIIVPFDYAELTHPNTIPICIADTDSRGNPINAGWVELGVVPVADGLVAIAERLLEDKYRTSEIAEYAVHALSRKHGGNFGDHPAMMVLNGAKWRAIDLRAGGRRARICKEVELFAETLDSLEEQYDVAAHLEADDMLDKIVEQLDVLGLDHVKRLLPWMLQNTEGHELTRQFGQKRNTITTRFYRGMRKAATAAGIEWE
jgi:hypothetical protein